MKRWSFSSKWGRICRPTRWASGRTGGRLGLDPELAGVAAGEVEQVVDHLLELAGALGDHLGGLELAGVERLALGGQHLGEALDHGHRRAQLVRDREHEVVLHLLDAVALARVALERVGHLVEGPAQGRDLDRPADLDPGPQVAAREPAGSLDEAAERRAHRVDQAGEEDQRGEQGAGEPGGHQDGRVARLGPGVVAGGVAGVAGRGRERLAAVGHRRGQPALDARRRDLPADQRLERPLAPGGLAGDELVELRGEDGVVVGQVRRPIGRVGEARRGLVELRLAGPLVGGGRARAACSRMKAERSRSVSSSSWK